MTELLPDTRRQASHIFRGYNYQAYQTILAWLKCGENDEVLPEFVEDVDLVRRDALGKITDAELTQVKNEKTSITLNSKASKDLIKNFFRHKKKNPDITLFIRLCTVSDRGKERSFDWLYADNGLDLWDLIKNRNLPESEQETAIGILKTFYTEQANISADALNFIQESDSTSFLSDFVDRISWDTGQSPYTEIEDDIKQILADLPRPINDPVEVIQVIHRLWYFVTHSIAGKPGKRLNRTDLEKILSEETTSKIDRENLKSLTADSKRTVVGIDNIEGMVSLLLNDQVAKHIQGSTPVQVIERQIYQSDLPPLPKPCADRSQELLKIQEELNDVCFLWIHGSTGYGKTTLANLFVRQESNKVLWFRLRNYSDFTLISALQKIYTIIYAQLMDGEIVVLDDLSIIEQHTYAIELLSMIFDYARDRSVKIVITSLYRIPTRLKAQIGDEFLEFVAPEISEQDISLLLKRSGLAVDEQLRFWSTYIYASTGGHPQLVSAYTAYARENKWIFTPEMLGQQPRSVDEVKAESRRLLAETIKNDEARELVKYLSLAVIPFDREFALNIGNAAPGIKDPGNALDILVGPWVESLGNDIYSLSPLLMGYTKANTGKTELEKYYMILCLAWLRKRTLTPTEVSQAMLSAITAKFDPLIAKLCNISFTTNSADFKNIAKELFIIPHLYIDVKTQLTGIHPMTRFMLRHFQLKITESNEDWKSYLRIYLQIQKEIIELDKSSLEYKTCLWLFYIDTIIRPNTPIPAKNRILQALTIIEMVHKNELTEITSFLNSDKLEIDTLLMFAVHNIDTNEDLEFLIRELKKRSDDIISSFFRGFESYLDDLSLMIDRVWLNESKKDNPEWNNCIRVFYETMEFARKYGSEWLLAGAARGIMVIYDEYLDDSKNALKTADKTRSFLEDSHPLIDLQEASVYYRSDQKEKVIEAISNLESSLEPEIMPILRVYALRKAIRCAGDLKNWDKVTFFAERGLQISRHILIEEMRELAFISFKAELGWSNYEKGELNEAAKQFESVLFKMEEVSNQKYPLFYIFHLRFGSALGWLAHTWKLKDTIVQLKTSILKPFAGMFAN